MLNLSVMMNMTGMSKGWPKPDFFSFIYNQNG